MTPQRRARLVMWNHGVYGALCLLVSGVCLAAGSLRLISHADMCVLVSVLSVLSLLNLQVYKEWMNGAR